MFLFILQRPHQFRSRPLHQRRLPLNHLHLHYLPLPLPRQPHLPNFHRPHHHLLQVHHPRHQPVQDLSVIQQPSQYHHLHQQPLPLQRSPLLPPKPVSSHRLQVPLLFLLQNPMQLARRSLTRRLKRPPRKQQPRPKPSARLKLKPKPKPNEKQRKNKNIVRKKLLVCTRCIMAISHSSIRCTPRSSTSRKAPSRWPRSTSDSACRL